MLQLREDIESPRLITPGKKLPRAQQFLNQFYKTSKLTADDVAGMPDVTPATANAFIQDFVKFGILWETTGGRRNRMFIFHEYLGLFAEEGKE